MKFATLITATVIAFASSAAMAATVGDLQKAGGKKLNKAEATAALLAQGYKMTRQGAKIDLTALADGTLSGKMKATQGDFEPKGTYTVADDGEVCIKTSFSAKHIHPQAPDQYLSFCVNSFTEKTGALRFARNESESTDLIDLLQ
jgi:hypothetical protein